MNLANQNAQKFVFAIFKMADESSVRKRTTNQPRYKPSWAKGEADYDPNLPYGPNVYLARKKKPDGWWVKYLEVSFCFAL